MQSIDALLVEHIAEARNAQDSTTRMHVLLTPTDPVKPVNPENHENAVNFAKGTVTNALAKTLCHPLERVSVIQQIDPLQPNYRTAVKQVFSGGLRGAYKGLSSQWLSSVTGAAGYLGVAMMCKRDDAPVFENALRCGMWSMVAEQASFVFTAAYIRQSSNLAPYSVSAIGWGRIFVGLGLRHFHGNPLTLGTIWSIEKNLDEVLPYNYHAVSSLVAGAAGAFAVHRCGLATLAAYFSMISCNPEQTLKQSWKQVLKQGIHAGGDARALNRATITGTTFALCRLFDMYTGKHRSSKSDVSAVANETSLTDHSHGLKQG